MEEKWQGGPPGKAELHVGGWDLSGGQRDDGGDDRRRPKKGVWRTRTVRRKTLAERWTRENLEMVGGVPWQMEEVDGEDLKLKVTVMDNDYREKVR